ARRAPCRRLRRIRRSQPCRAGDSRMAAWWRRTGGGASGLRRAIQEQAAGGVVGLVDVRVAEGVEGGVEIVQRLCGGADPGQNPAHVVAVVAVMEQSQGPGGLEAVQEAEEGAGAFG